MNFRILLSSLLFFISFVITAQPLGPAIPVAMNPADGTLQAIVSADLDGDGLKDVIMAGGLDNIFWSKNLGGSSFGAPKVIYTDEVFGEGVDVMDVDADGDIDIVAAMSFANLVGWFENDGMGHFGALNIIAQNLDPLDDLLLSDVDGDGDKDILFSTYSAVDKVGSVFLSSNLSNGNFSSPQYVIFSAHETRHINCSDLNGDGHQDVISASYWDGNFVWAENTGNGTFYIVHAIRENGIDNFCSYPIDLDNDGDMDLLYRRYYGLGIQTNSKYGIY